MVAYHMIGTTLSESKFHNASSCIPGAEYPGSALFILLLPYMCDTVAASKTTELHVFDDVLPAVNTLCYSSTHVSYRMIINSKV